MSDWRSFFDDRRRSLATLLVPDKDSLDPYFPFDCTEYPYSEVLDDHVGTSTRVSWRGMPAYDLLSGDPFKESQSGWPSVWDAAVGIPAVTIRGRSTYHTNNVPVPRNINDTWQNRTMIDLSRIGRATPESEYRRPVGDWLLDVVTHRNGWRLLELAHMLAHVAEDTELLSRRERPYTYGQNCSLFHMFLFKAFMCLKFGLPIDVRMDGDDPDTNDMFDRYGIVASISTKLREPMILVPSIGRGCLRPGRDICVVSGTVHIEPTPHSAATGSGKWLEMNRWSCEPTITAFAGWELADFVVHSPLVVQNGQTVPAYALPAQAMLKSDDFHYFLECAESSRGKCVPDGDRYRLVDEYLESDDFRSALLSSPPLPCKRCFMLNMQSAGSPSRPRCERPNRRHSKDETPSESEREWIEWNEKMDKIFKTVEKATRFMELRDSGALAARKARKTRKSAYSKKVNGLRRARFLAGRVKKLRVAGYIEKADELERKIEELKGGANAT